MITITVMPLLLWDRLNTKIIQFLSLLNKIGRMSLLKKLTRNFRVFLLLLKNINIEIFFVLAIAKVHRTAQVFGEKYAIFNKL